MLHRRVKGTDPPLSVDGSALKTQRKDRDPSTRTRQLMVMKRPVPAALPPFLLRSSSPVLLHQVEVIPWRVDRQPVPRQSASLHGV
ncbi:hypothetical protein EYF80_045491 [Liparis tanakae]|uniref:Uncharacterized protein n=1 Tax=Liparis tanakae TaxID=230148 RepID=A0A4Z2FT31_9TELE|nr:hypothetical protein EYF80_045491 [Liparis tanakae]